MRQQTQLKRLLLEMAILRNRRSTLEDLTKLVNANMVDDYCTRTIRRDLNTLMSVGVVEIAACVGDYGNTPLFKFCGEVDLRLGALCAA